MKRFPKDYPWRLGLPVSLYFSAVAIFPGYNSKFYQQAGIQADSPCKIAHRQANIRPPASFYE